MDINRITEHENIGEKIRELTSYIMHKHYCENDVEALISLLDDRLSWFGTGEEEYATGTETVSAIFREFAGMVPRCFLSDEEYTVLEITPEVWLCTGRVWITSDPEAGAYIRVHQRTAMLWRLSEGRARCCHIHISNPYMEMVEGDVGFPTQVARHTYEYVQESIEQEKRQIQEQTEELLRMSYEDMLTGLMNQNRFNEDLEDGKYAGVGQLGVACFDLNALKVINDTQGHRAGDDYIRRTAKHMNCVFPGKTYRIGGDEFAVLDDSRDRESFAAGIEQVKRLLEEDDITVSAGFSWRAENCNVKEQLDEADRLMYEDKKRYYRDRESGRTH